MKQYTKDFWEALDRLLAASELVIDRPKGSFHPRYPDIVYPISYGYLQDTASMDGDGIDLWLGSAEEKRLDAVILTVDLLKRDSEIKLLIGCTEKEKETILHFHNDSPYMKGMLIKR